MYVNLKLSVSSIYWSINIVLFQVKSIKFNQKIEAWQWRPRSVVTVDVEVAIVVAVAVSPVEVTVAFSVVDHRWCLIIESSNSFFTDLSFGGLELT